MLKIFLLQLYNKIYRKCCVIKDLKKFHQFVYIENRESKKVIKDINADNVYNHMQAL
mgnify:CR=1 FL=1